MACLVVAAAGACTDAPTQPIPSGEPATVEVTASVRAPTVSTLVVEVTAPDIPDPLLFNFELPEEPDPTTGERSASSTLDLPSGADRLFTVRAFDTQGIQTHEGEAVQDVHPGLNLDPVVITLFPLTGEKEFAVVLGSVNVDVTPETATVGVGGTVQLTASITDGDGNAVADAEARWATLNPAIATVDQTGLVTGVLEGTVQIVATFAGVGGATDITVGTASENTAPTVTILSPSDGATFPEGEEITLSGKASDVEEGDLSELIEWSSNLVTETLGVGATLEVALAEGTHTITAAITDSEGLTGEAMVQIVVEALSASRISFASNRSGNFDLWFLDPDGTGEPEQFTASVATETEPAWSPEGTRIAYVSDAPGNLDIFIANADGSGTPLQLTQDPGRDQNASWSPDGGRIAFASDRNGSLDVFVMAADGSGAPVSVATTAADDFSPSWSPDGSRIVYASKVDGDFELFVVDVAPDGTPGIPQRLTDNDLVDTTPVWSPVDDRIVFVRRMDSNSDIWVMDLAGSTTPVQLTTDPATDGDPDWSPDGTRVVFTSFRDGNGEIYVRNADGAGSPNNLTLQPSMDVLPAWEP